MYRITDNDKQQGTGKPVLNYNYLRVLCKSIAAITIYHIIKNHTVDQS